MAVGETSADTLKREESESTFCQAIRSVFWGFIAVLIMPVERCRNAEDLLHLGIGPLETKKLQSLDGLKIFRDLE